MARRLLVAGAFVLASVAVAAPPANPVAGVVREPDQTLRSIYGFSSNLINGAPLPIRDVAAASFSSDAGIVLIAGSLEFVNLDGTVLGSYATEELHPVLGVAADDSRIAAAWLPSEEKLIRLSSSQVSVFPLSAAKLPGPIVALKIASPNSVDLWTKAQASAVQRFRLSLSSGALSPLETVTGIASNIAVINGSLLSADSGNLRIQSPGGTVRSLPFPFSDLTFQSASDHWIHIVSASAQRQWMLRVDASDVSISELPAVAPLAAEVTR